MTAKAKAKPSFRRKCKLCDKYITDESDAVEYKGGYVHTNCFAASVKSVQAQRAEKEEERQKKKRASKPSDPSFRIPKKGLSEEEYAKKVDFFDTVKQILKVQQLPAKVYAMGDHLIEKYKYFTYSGMKETLLYCQRNMESDLTDDCMGLIPYYYDEAMSEAKRIEEAQKNAEATADQMITGTEVVVIPDPATRPNNKLINIEEIG